MHYLIVGTGFYGSVIARQLAEQGDKVTIIDKRNHIGGNCYTEVIDGIPVHKYGPHAFHTNSERVWEFCNKFVEFNGFRLQVKVDYKGKIYSFPVNMMTLSQLYGITRPSEAKKALASSRVKVRNVKTFEDHCLNTIGRELYEIFFYGYTHKQWNMHPNLLGASVAKRIPVRLEYNDYYFTDKYQGIPIGGYTRLFENMLDHKNIKVLLDVDFFENRKDFERKFKKIIYSGKIDELLEYKHGMLAYRSLKFDFKKVSGTYQGNSIINYTEYKVPHTRIVEHKYFSGIENGKSVISIEYPDDYSLGKTPFYPIPAEENQKLYQKYRDEILGQDKYLIGGRLGRYQYLNMDQVIGMALIDFDSKLAK